jgi:hypothetical protein
VIPTNHLRLSFGQVAPDQIAPGIERLASVVREQLGGANLTSQISDSRSVGAIR